MFKRKVSERLFDILPIIERGKSVIKAEADALAAVEASIGERFAAACQLIVECERQLVITGMGKSGHIGRKIAATFSATGTPAIFVHPSEAGHGDLGKLAPGDVLLVLSNSGNTSELRLILNYAKRLRLPLIGVASRQSSLVMQKADIGLLLPNVREACSANIAPTTSTTMQLALGDALAMAVMDMRGISKPHLQSLHPGGTIGLALTPVAELMHSDERMPLISGLSGMPEAISVMTSACFGIAGVVDADGKLIGIITDGDLRRRFGALGTAFAHEVMTSEPKVIAPNMPAEEALVFLNDNKITAVFVVPDPDGGPQVPLGILHIHDLLRQGLS